MRFSHDYVLPYVFKNGPFPASFFFIFVFQYTVDRKQMFNINKFLPMTGFEPRTSGIGSDQLSHTTTALYFTLCFMLTKKIYLAKRFTQRLILLNG